MPWMGFMIGSVNTALNTKQSIFFIATLDDRARLYIVPHPPPNTQLVWCHSLAVGVDGSIPHAMSWHISILIKQANGNIANTDVNFSILDKSGGNTLYSVSYNAGLHSAKMTGDFKYDGAIQQVPTLDTNLKSIAGLDQTARDIVRKIGIPVDTLDLP